MAITKEYLDSIRFEIAKQKYYNALAHYDKTGEVDPFVAYMKECMEQTWDVKPVPERKLQDMLDLSGEQTLG